MIDYLKLEKHFTDKDKPFLGLCTKTGESYGWQWFQLRGHNPIKIGWNESTLSMKVSGSLSYFSQGSNFTFTDADLVNAVNFVGNFTKCSLWDAEVTELEYGKIIPTPFPPKDYIRNTSGTKGYKLTQADTYIKRFRARFLDIKLYDAGRNILEKQGINDRQVIIQQGWNPEEYFLKIENHYYEPWRALNWNREIKLAELLSPDFTNRMKEDLFLHYDRLHKMKTIIPPESKKDLSTQGILMLMYAEEKTSQGCTLQEMKETIYRKIDILSEETDAAPEPALTKEDGKARKKQMKALMERLHLSDKSQWDVSDELVAALNQ